MCYFDGQRGKKTAYSGANSLLLVVLRHMSSHEAEEDHRQQCKMKEKLEKHAKYTFWRLLHSYLHSVIE